MATGIDDRHLRALVEEVLHERFEGVEIHSIGVVRDTDEDGDSILRLKVVFDGEKKTLDSRRASSVVRHMLARFAEAGEYAFPVISYIAKSDLRKSGTAALA